MPQDVNSILSRPIQPFGEDPQRQKLAETGKTSFKDILSESIRKVNDLQSDADTAVERLVTGETDNVSQVYAAVEKADLAFRHLMAVRNKLIDAFDEIRRLRV